MKIQDLVGKKIRNKKWLPEIFSIVKCAVTSQMLECVHHRDKGSVINEFWNITWKDHFYDEWEFVDWRDDPLNQYTEKGGNNIEMVKDYSQTQIKACVCMSKDLFNFGCKCGGN